MAGSDHVRVGAHYYSHAPASTWRAGDSSALQPREHLLLIAVSNRSPPTHLLILSPSLCPYTLCELTNRLVCLALVAGGAQPLLGCCRSSLLKSFVPFKMGFLTAEFAQARYMV